MDIAVDDLITFTTKTVAVKKQEKKVTDDVVGLILQGLKYFNSKYATIKGLAQRETIQQLDKENKLDLFMKDIQSVKPTFEPEKWDFSIYRDAAKFTFPLLAPSLFANLYTENWKDDRRLDDIKTKVELYTQLIPETGFLEEAEHYLQKKVLASDITTATNNITYMSSFLLAATECVKALEYLIEYCSRYNKQVATKQLLMTNFDGIYNACKKTIGVNSVWCMFALDKTEAYTSLKNLFRLYSPLLQTDWFDLDKTDATWYTSDPKTIHIVNVKEMTSGKYYKKTTSQLDTEDAEKMVKLEEHARECITLHIEMLQKYAKMLAPYAIEPGTSSLLAKLLALVLKLKNLSLQPCKEVFVKGRIISPEFSYFNGKDKITTQHKVDDIICMKYGLEYTGIEKIMEFCTNVRKNK